MEKTLNRSIKIDLPEVPYNDDIRGLLSQLQTDPESGLTGKEVAKRRVQFGPNRLSRQKSRPLHMILLDQFLDPVIYVLAVAAAIGFIFGESIEAIAVLIVIVITAMIGFFM